MAAPPPFSWTGGAIHLDVIVGAGLLGGAYLGLMYMGGRDGPPKPPTWDGRMASAPDRRLASVHDGRVASAVMFFGGLLALVAADLRARIAHCLGQGLESLAGDRDRVALLVARLPHPLAAVAADRHELDLERLAV